MWGSKKLEPPKIQLPLHPFFPVEIELVDYLANDKDVLTLLGIFFAACGVVLGGTWVIVSKVSPKLRIGDKSIILWFMLCGSIHLFFEGYFAFNHSRMAPAQNIFGQLWKEYALADSRYLTSDPFVLCMESITAICWGPLSFYVVYLITVQHPLRYPLQAVVSLGQLYGDVLYYATSFFDLYYKNLVYSRPEGYYFWFYFIFLNSFWIVIPVLLLYQSISITGQAFKALDRMSKSLQGNGALKKPQNPGQTKKTA